MHTRAPQWTIFHRLQETEHSMHLASPPWTLPGMPGAPRNPSPLARQPRPEARAQGSRRPVAWPSVIRPDRSGELLSERS